MLPQFDQEQLLLQIAEAQTSTFIVKDLQHRYLMVNQHFADRVKKDIADIIGKNDLEIGIPESMVLGDEKSGYPGFWALDKQAIDACHIQRNSEEEIAYRIGQLHDGHTARTPLLDKNNRVVALLIQSHDVSDFKKLEHSLQQSLQIRENQLSMLNSLMADMMAYQNLDPLLEHIASVMVAYTPADNSLIMLVDETQDYIQVMAGAGSHSHQNIGKRINKCEAFAGLAWSTGKTQYFHDYKDNKSKNNFWPTSTQLVAVPLLVDSRVIGVAVLGAPGDQASFKTSAALIKSLANLAGISIASAKAQEWYQQELTRTRALSEISYKICNFEETETLFSSVSKTLIDVMGTFRASSYTVSANGDFKLLGAWQKTDNGIARGESIPVTSIKESISYWCFSQRKMAFIPRNSEDPRESSEMHEFRRRLNVGSTLCIPITSQECVKGIFLICRDNNTRDFDENDINLLTSIVNQLSNALYSKELSDALKHQAHHDHLTQLPNRRYFENELKYELDNCTACGTSGAVMFLDLDGFKTINDTLGHVFGDDLLYHVSCRLRSQIQSSDFLARIGGDEFALILRNINSHQDAITIANRLSESLKHVFKIHGSKLKIGVSIGISFYPDDAKVSHDLLRNADEAMYRSKTGGEGNITRFNQAMADESRQRMQIKRELFAAIEKRQFTLLYQPQVSTQTGAVECVEALIRWRHPSGKNVLPDTFIPIAEDAGYINLIGFWVIDEAISQLMAWQRTDFNNVRISINIAATQFLHENFADTLLQKLAENCIPPLLLEIEVTENIALKDIHTVIKRLDQLRSSGVRIAVDDFGTGYSSLSYLQELPLDVLKIDRSFIKKLEQGQSDNSFVNTILLLAQGLGLETVAEGVETAEQMERVLQLGCSYVQGFYFAKPCEASELRSEVERIQSGFARPSVATQN